MPSFHLDNEEIELVPETKLLGIVIRNDMSWISNTQYMVTKAYKKLWILRRLKRLGATQNDLLDIYVKQVRSHLEYAIPVWHSALTGDQRLQIERVQKSALRIILGAQYTSYTSALKILKIDTLNNRRIKLCKKFAVKTSKNEKFNKWFKVNDISSLTRLKKNPYCPVYSRTKRFENSPISYITNLLNSM